MNSIQLFFSFFSAYNNIGKKPKPDANNVECNFGNLPGEDQFCQVQTSELITGPCTEDNHYGFDKGKPCILIKLNKVRITFGYPSLLSTLYSTEQSVSYSCEVIYSMPSKGQL